MRHLPGHVPQLLFSSAPILPSDAHAQSCPSLFLKGKCTSFSHSSRGAVGDSDGDIVGSLQVAG